MIRLPFKYFDLKQKEYCISALISSHFAPACAAELSEGSVRSFVAHTLASRCMAALTYLEANTTVLSEGPVRAFPARTCTSSCITTASIEARLAKLVFRFAFTVASMHTANWILDRYHDQYRCWWKVVGSVTFTVTHGSIEVSATT